MSHHIQTRRTYDAEQLTTTIYSILSPTQPLTRSEISLKLGGRVDSVRIWKTINQLVEDGKALKFSGHPNLYLRATDDQSVTFTIRGTAKIRG